MKVVIKEKEYDYLPDYPKGWLFASGDPFKFPVEIGRYTCFIKRFEKKSPEAISGWSLLTQLKDKFDPNLPRIYDVVETEENRKLIHYIFYEYLAGETLEAAVSRNANLDLRRLTYDLFKGLEALHQKRFWFMDFCEKNIFCEASGRFLLIDLDSVQPFSQVPHNHMDGDKQYWALVFNFYKEQLGYKDLKPSDISGPLLNYLQMIFLTLRLKISLIDKNYDYKSAELYDNLPALLQETDPGFKEIFARAFTESRQAQRLLTAAEVRDFIVRHIIDNDQVPYRPSLNEPIIRSFTASASQVVPGQAFSLSWEVSHAIRLALYRNGVLFKELRSTATSLEINEGYDGKPKKVVYTLVAANSATQITSEPLTVHMAELLIPAPVPVSEPEPEVVFAEQTLPLVDHTTTPLDINDTPLKASPPLTTSTTTINQTPIPKEMAIPVIKPDPHKLRTIRLALLVLFLAIAGILGVLVKSLLSRKKMEIAPLKTSVTEGDTFIIPGKNFPDEANKVQVLFNGIKSSITGQSVDTLRVIVPELPTNRDSTLAKVGLVVGKDTIFAANPVSVRKNTLLLTQVGPGQSSDNPEVKQPDSTNQSDGNSASTSTETAVILENELGKTTTNGNKGNARKRTNRKTSGTGTTKTTNPPSVTVEPELPKEPPANIHEFVSVKSNVIANQRRKGTKDLQITVQNTSAFDLDNVDVEIHYMKRNGKSLQKEILSFTKVRAHSSQTLTAPDNERGKKVDFKIIAINSKPIY